MRNLSYFLCSMWKQIIPFHKHRSLLSPFSSILLSCSSVSSNLCTYQPIFPPSIRHQSAYFFGCEYHCTTSLSEDNGKRKRLEVEIISVELIKPAVSTPGHSKQYKLSLLDQIYPKIYIPFVYFYQNDDKQQHSELINHGLVLKRREILKQSLSETLIKFYPLAGKISEDGRFIDCNDEGVYYVEARVNDRLFDFLKKPDNKLIHQLLPFDPSSKELWSMTYVTMIQATVFGCGGFAIGLYNSHKIMDGHSYATLMKAWAATARGCSLVCPHFLSTSIFLPKCPIQQPQGVEEASYPLSAQKREKSVTRRFVFSASSLMALKKKTSAPTRVIAVACLIWKCFITAKLRSSTSHDCEAKSYTVYLAVNLRTRSRPPLPPYSIGNIILTALTQYKVNAGTEVELGTLMRLVNNAVDGINSDFIEKMKGEDGYLGIEEYKKKIIDVLCGQDMGDSISVASLCNSGMYEVDFGWGKPVWISLGTAGIDNPLVENEVCLMDTINPVYERISRYSISGIEAWVTLTEKDMAIFQCALLDFACLDPSPVLLG